MAYLRPMAFLLFYSVLCVCSGGCIVFYSYAPVEVTVRDAEMDAPIPSAHVGVKTELMAVLNTPCPDSAVTDEHGIAMLTAATRQPQTWNVAAKGYLPYSHGTFVDRSEPKSQKLQFLLYKEPSPHVHIIVPNNFQGPLKVELRPISALVQHQVGERDFTFRASENGYVRIDATPLLQNLIDHIDAIDAEYEGGTKIPQSDYGLRPAVVGRRYIYMVGHRILFVIGTEEDVQALRPMIYHYRNGDPHNISTNIEAFDALFSEASTKPSRKPGG